MALAALSCQIVILENHTTFSKKTCLFFNRRGRVLNQFHLPESAGLEQLSGKRPLV